MTKILLEPLIGRKHPRNTQNTPIPYFVILEALGVFFFSSYTIIGILVMLDILRGYWVVL